MVVAKNTRWPLIALLLPMGWGCKAPGVAATSTAQGTGGSGGSTSSATSSSRATSSSGATSSTVAGTGGSTSGSVTASSGTGGTGGTCPTGEVLQGGVCEIACDAGAKACDGGCIDTATDPANCGACGKACPGNKVCTGSACVPPHCTGPLSFTMAASYGAAAIPDTFSLADLNGDGRPDIVVATSTYNLNGGTAEILVLINKGDGTFNAGVAYPIAHDSTVGIGDLNGDGKPEIVVSNSGSSTITVLLNNGDGTFTAQPAVTLAAAAGALSVGDVNGDGKPDVYWFGAGTLNTLINQGGGNLGTTPVVVNSFGTTNIGADLAGLKLVDVLYTSAGTSIYASLNGGMGTFPAAGTQYFAMASVTALVLADWNGDGKPDILAQGTPNTLMLNGGTGTFSTQFAFTSPAAFTTAADMTGSGHGNLISLGSTGISDVVNVWLNDGNNNFTKLVATPIALYNNGQVAVTDLNGDGLLDFVTLSSPSSHSGILSVALNTCPH